MPPAMPRSASALRWRLAGRRGLADPDAMREETGRLATAIDAAVGTHVPSEPTWCILSTIRTSRDALSYSPVRSVFSAGERLSQTRESIASVRRFYPTAQVVVLDASDPGAAALSAIRAEGALAVALPPGSAVGRAVASPHKGLGEAMLLLTALASRVAVAGGIWKLSGRYALTGAPPTPSPAGFAVRWRGREVSTVCYGAARPLVPVLRDDLLARLPRLVAGEAIEAVMTDIISSRGWETADSPPVIGRVAVDGTTFAS